MSFLHISFFSFNINSQSNSPEPYCMHVNICIYNMYMYIYIHLRACCYYWFKRCIYKYYFKQRKRKRFRYLLILRWVLSKFRVKRLFIILLQAFQSCVRIYSLQRFNNWVFKMNILMWLGRILLIHTCTKYYYVRLHTWSNCIHF